MGDASPGLALLQMFGTPRHILPLRSVPIRWCAALWLGGGSLSQLKLHKPMQRKHGELAEF